MKRVLIGLIRLYQKLPLKSHSLCRYEPTCSEYMIEAINEYGCFYGMYLGVKRILRCRPGGDMGYDPVPLKEDK